MKHPENLLLHGQKVILTSYKPTHVPKYHDWMGNDEILRLTGSERLTLQEEYEMQQDWENDPKKCTFIILSKTLYEKTNCEIASMIGDTNLFLQNQEPSDNNHDDDGNEERAAEIEVMIAETEFRRQGCAKEALKLIMDYAINFLNINTFFAKIKADNEGSIQLFSNLGYTFESKSDIFNEVCYLYKVEK